MNYEKEKYIDKDIHKDKIISIIYGFPIPSKYFSCMSSALLTFTVAAKYDQIDLMGLALMIGDFEAIATAG